MPSSSELERLGFLRQMSGVIFLLLALIVLQAEIGWAWSSRKYQGRKYEKQWEEREKESSKEEQARNQPTNVKALIDQADALAREGSSKQEIDKAISLLKEAVRLAKDRDIPSAVGRASVLLGLIYLWRSEFEEALVYSNRGVQAAKQSGNCQMLTRAKRNIGNVFKAAGRYDDAVGVFAEAISTAKDCNDKVQMAWSLWNWGEICRFQGDYAKALKLLEKASVIAQEIGDREIQGYAKQEIGLVYTAIGQYSKAADNLKTALTIGESIDRPRIQQEALGGLGDVYFAWGKYSDAANYFQKTLDQAKRRGEKRREAAALTSQGTLYAEWGRYNDALTCFQKALTLTKVTGIELQQSRILMEMGMLCSSRGQYHRAVELFEQSLEYSRRLGNAKGEGAVLDNLGVVYHAWGHSDKALGYLEEALAIYKRIGVPTGSVSSQIGNLYLDIGDIQRAEPFMRESGDLGSVGRLCLVKADHSSAKAYYQSLLDSAEQNRNTNNLFTAHTGLGMACEGMGDNVNAEKHYRKAVEYTEVLRSSLSPAERDTFFDVKIKGFHRTTPYEGLARVLMRMNKPLEAFKGSELTKARVFAEAISRLLEGTQFDVPAEALKLDQDITNQLAALKKALQQAYEKDNKLGIEVLKPQVKEFENQFLDHKQMLREKYPLFAATKYPEPLHLDQIDVKDDQWVLSYDLTDSCVIVYLTRGKSLIKALLKEVSRNDIDELIRQFRGPMERVASGADPVEELRSFDLVSGKKLADILLSGVIQELPAGTPVILVPDDSLGVLPFEMLPLTHAGRVIIDRRKMVPCVTGATFFGDRNPITYCQSVTALGLAGTFGRAKSSGDRCLVMADPIFGPDDSRLEELLYDEKINSMGSALETLMSAKQELNITWPRLELTAELGDFLRRLDPERTDLFLGKEANKEKLFSWSLRDYRSVVFATHGYAGLDLPGIQEPVLVLTLWNQPEGKDGFLRLSEVINLKLNAEVVALTACESGLGRRISGEGVMGMGRAFQYAGAKSVLMSLWSVEQTASINLVENFFKHVQQGRSKLEALKLARNEIRAQGYDHPFFWAPFILVGEAR